MDYFYIKKNGEYWHKFKRRWISNRCNVPGFISLKALKEYVRINNANTSYARIENYDVVCVSTSDEVIIKEDV